METQIIWSALAVSVTFSLHYFPVVNGVSEGLCNIFWNQYTRNGTHTIHIMHRDIMDTNPVDYIAYFYKNSQDSKKLKMPRVLHARISPNHRDCPRRPFTQSWVGWRMKAMGAVAADKSGHIIPPQFCGPAAWYNLAPLNPVGRSGWRSMASKVAAYLRDKKTVDVTIALVYGAKGQSRRPTYFKVCIIPIYPDAVGQLFDIDN